MCAAQHLTAATGGRAARARAPRAARSGARRVLRTYLDAVRLIIDIKHSFLYLLIDLFGGVDESLLDVGGSLGRRLHEDEAVLASERFAFFLLHFTSGFEIALVTDKHNDHIRVGMLSRVLEPRCEMIESLPSGDVVN